MKEIKNIPRDSLDRSEFCHSILPKIFYPKIATSLIAGIVENNEDKNLEHQTQG